MAGVPLEAVWKAGAALPGVVRSAAYGSPALKVRGQLMAAVPTNKSAEPGSLMIRVDRKTGLHCWQRLRNSTTSRTTMLAMMRCWCGWSG